MTGGSPRGRRSSGLPHSARSSSAPIPSPHSSRKVRFIKRGLSIQKSLSLLSDTDHEILTTLSEHRVVTTQQLSSILVVPERTIRYRLERLWKLGLAGGMQPYAERGSSPMHWWPSRAADAYTRGAPLPQGGEREDPKEAFLRHAAAITGLYAALLRLAPTLGWEVLSWARETEAREEFTVGNRRSAVVPDVALVLRAGEATYHTLVEVDLGTMSIPRATRKLGLYAGWVRTRAWEERHPYPPVVLFLTTTERRAEKILGRAEQRLGAESARAYDLSETRLLDSLVVAASDCVHRPEAALADPVWTARTGETALRLQEVLHPPWERWSRQMAEERSRREHVQALRERLARDPEAQRAILQERWKDSTTGGVDEYLSHVFHLDPEARATLDVLIEETEPMTEVERRAYGFYLRRTRLDDENVPRAVKETLPLTADEREAIAGSHALYLERQRRMIGALHRRHPHLSWLVRTIRELEKGTLLSGWSRRNVPAAISNGLRRVETADERMAEYLKWREEAIEHERRGYGFTARTFVHTRARVARRLDEKGLRLCPPCEQLFAIAEEERGSTLRQPACPHCGATETLLRLSEGEIQGWVALDERGSWQMRHRPVPGWATGETVAEEEPP